MLPPPFLPRFPVPRALAPQVPTPSTRRLRGRAHKFKRRDPQEQLFPPPPTANGSPEAQTCLTGCLEPLFRPHSPRAAAGIPLVKGTSEEWNKPTLPLLAWGPHHSGLSSVTAVGETRGQKCITRHETTRGAATQRESGNQNPLLSMFSAFPTPFLHTQPPLQTHSATLELQGATRPNGQFYP